MRAPLRAPALPLAGALLTLALASCTEPGPSIPQGPEPTVWIGLAEDVNEDGTVRWAYPAYYAHTRRPDRIWGLARWDTSNFHAGASQLFERDGYGADVMGDGAPADVAASIEVFNQTGAMLDAAFTHARYLGVKTALGTELPLGREPRGPEVGESWVRGMPPELQARLEQRGLDPADPAVVKDVYKGIFTRIQRAHPLDYYWLWGWEVWSLHGASRRQIKALEADLQLAHEALRETDAPFQLALGGWILGTADDPAEFDDALPPELPFVGLWDEADGFEELSPERVKWPGTWLEEDWGLAQPQLELRRLHADVSAALAKDCDGVIAKHWRTRALSANTAGLKELLWVYGETGEALERATPPDRDVWIERAYLDWSTRQFGPEAAPEIAAIFAALDIAGEDGEGRIPRPLGWDSDLEDIDNAAPGAIMLPGDESEEDEAPTTTWSEDQARYAFVDALAAQRARVVGAGNRARFDYWLKAFQILRLMGEYSFLRQDFESLADQERGAEALEKRRELARVWERLMTLEVEKATNESDLGEILNLEILNWHQLVQLKWDPILSELGQDPTEAEPSRAYTGASRVVVIPARTDVAEGEALTLKIVITGEPSAATLFFRVMGEGDYASAPLVHRARGVYEAVIPPQADDFEYYVVAETPAGTAVFPESAPTIAHTVVVLPTAD